MHGLPACVADALKECHILVLSSHGCDPVGGNANSADRNGGIKGRGNMTASACDL